MVGFQEMIALIAVVSMHSIRIDHEVELLALLMHDIQKLEGVLMVDVVVSGAVSQFNMTGSTEDFSTSLEMTLDAPRNDVYDVG